MQQISHHSDESVRPRQGCAKFPGRRTHPPRDYAPHRWGKSAHSKSHATSNSPARFAPTQTRLPVLSSGTGRATCLLQADLYRPRDTSSLSSGTMRMRRQIPVLFAITSSTNGVQHSPTSQQMRRNHIRSFVIDSAPACRCTSTTLTSGSHYHSYLSVKMTASATIVTS